MLFSAAPSFNPTSCELPRLNKKKLFLRLATHTISMNGRMCHSSDFIWNVDEMIISALMLPKIVKKRTHTKKKQTRKKNAFIIRVCMSTSNISALLFRRLKIMSKISQICSFDTLNIRRASHISHNGNHNNSFAKTHSYCEQFTVSLLIFMMTIRFFSRFSNFSAIDFV